MAAITNLDSYNKPTITVPTKQYKELRQSRERLELELEEKAKKIKSLSEKNVALEQKNKNLENQAKNLEERLKEALSREFLGIQKEWEEIAGCKPYERFFNRNAQSLQTLLGLPKAMETMTAEKIDYYFWEAAANQIIGDRKHFGGIFWDGKLLLPETMESSKEPEITANLTEEPLKEIERYIYEDKRKVKGKRTALQKKRVVQQLGPVLEELERQSQCQEHKEKTDLGFIREIAKNIGTILENNGIYPMFAKDERLEDNGALQEGFVPANTFSIKYPALFVEWDGGYEVLGDNVGMDA